MTRTVWDGRFEARRGIPVLEAFNASIAADAFLAEAEIDASTAYARALGRAGRLSETELAQIVTGLEAVRARLRRGEDLSRFEDIHTAVELLLVEEAGEPGRKLHTGRSRNEQVATDERLFLKARVPEAVRLIAEIQAGLVAAAEAHFDAVMPGYTHLRRGQPVLYAHYLLAFFWALERGKERLRDALVRVDVLPLGSGALAGSTAGVDVDFLKDLLGFAAAAENSIDAVTDRTFLLEVLFALGLVLLDVARLAEDVILFSTEEFGFLELDDRLTTSSSLMPQKKNPDVFELLRAAPGRLFGRVQQLLLTLKGLPSAYNKDLQEDKEPLERGVADALRALEAAALAVPLVRPVPERMRAAIDAFTFATDLADELVDGGVPFREAHAVVGGVVRRALAEGRPLDTWSEEDWSAAHPGFGPGTRGLFDPWVSIERKTAPGSTHPARVRDQLARAKERLRPTGTSP